LRFSKSHEYVRADERVGTVGISQYAADQLGDVVYVELPDLGKTFGKDDEFGVVESVKAVSSLYAPVSGTVVAANDDLREHPEYVNLDPYGKGWLIKLSLANTDELDAIMTPEQYAAEVGSH
jgi:glycine cleavage system H protein